MKEGIKIDSNWCCWECGTKYLKEQGFPISDGVHTYHKNECCVCRETKGVTHERKFRWLARWKSDKKQEQ